MSEKYPVDEKVVNVNEQTLDRYDSSPAPGDRWMPPEEWLERLVADYSGQHSGNSETLPPGTNPNRMAASVLTFSEEESIKILEAFVINHSDDYSIDRKFLARAVELAKGHTACDMEEGEWAYATCKTAGLINNWSPYAEVRAVTVPYDDPDEPCESFRAYLIGMFWVCVATAVNTCEIFWCHIFFNLLTSGSFQSPSAWYLHPWRTRSVVLCSYGPWPGLCTSRLGLYTMGNTLYAEPRAMVRERTASGYYHLTSRHYW